MARVHTRQAMARSGARASMSVKPTGMSTVNRGAYNPYYEKCAELYKLPMMNRGDGRNKKDWRHLGDWRVLVDGAHKFGWSSNDTHFLVDLGQDPEDFDRSIHAQLVKSLADAGA